jgi:hypothetical protein
MNPNSQRRHRKPRLSRPWKRDIHQSEGNKSVFMEVNEVIGNGEREPVEYTMEDAFESLTTNKGTHVKPSSSLHILEHNLKRKSPGKNADGSIKSSAEDHVVVLERSLRQAGFLLLTYCLGVYLPVGIHIARRMVEYILVAWITCRVIMLIASNTKKPTKVDIANSNRNLGDITMKALNSHRNILLDDDNLETESEDDENKEHATSSENFSPSQSHPALESLYVINTFNGTRFIPNSSEDFILDNDLFVGRMLIMIRTPDVNDDSATKGTTENTNVFVPYFSTRKRRFEFQWQLKLNATLSHLVYTSFLKSIA